VNERFCDSKIFRRKKLGGRLTALQIEQQMLKILTESASLRDLGALSEI
jgi:hypothetical protein